MRQFFFFRQSKANKSKLKVVCYRRTRRESEIKGRNEGRRRSIELWCSGSSEWAERWEISMSAKLWEVCCCECVSRIIHATSSSLESSRQQDFHSIISRPPPLNLICFNLLWIAIRMIANFNLISLLLSLLSVSLFLARDSRIAFANRLLKLACIKWIANGKQRRKFIETQDCNLSLKSGGGAQE